MLNCVRGRGGAGRGDKGVVGWLCTLGGELSLRGRWTACDGVCSAVLCALCGLLVPPLVLGSLCTVAATTVRLGGLTLFSCVAQG